MTKHKVLVVDDSAFMRKIISEMISDDSDFQVVGTASDGAEAIQLVKQMKPDLITMDIQMPNMNGLEALEVIMREMPTPVIMISNLTYDGAAITIQALELGAVDFVHKPSGTISLDLYTAKQSLLEKLKIAAQSNVKIVSKQWLDRSESDDHEQGLTDRMHHPPKHQRTFDQLVAIGTSTGGPKALRNVITQLPKAFPAPLLIVQHMPPKFTKSLAESLNAKAQIKVVEAVEGEVIQAGTAYIAPGGRHMVLLKQDGQYRISLNEEPARNGHRPSVDVLFESLAEFKELQRFIVIMTGMGRDGALGMKLLKDKGATTIAESRETCIVDGMPKAAIELNAVDDIVPLNELAERLIKLTKKI